MYLQTVEQEFVIGCTSVAGEFIPRSVLKNLKTPSPDYGRGRSRQDKARRFYLTRIISQSKCRVAPPGIDPCPLSP